MAAARRRGRTHLIDTGFERDPRFDIGTDWRAACSRVVIARQPGVTPMPLSKKLGAECVGTFWLVLGGCGSAVIAAKFPEIGIGLVGVALAFGLTVVTMAY